MERHPMIFKYRESTYMDKNMQIVRTQRMVPMKRLSRAGKNPDINWITDYLLDYDSEFFPKMPEAKDGELFKLCYLVIGAGYYAELEQLWFEKVEFKE